MKIVIAPNAFKESLTALAACEAIERGIKRVFPYCEIVKIPLADGGDGTVVALVAALGGEIINYLVTGPLGNQVKASLGVLQNQIAIIEMAQASGLKHIPPEQRNPLKTTSWGTGELIKNALDLGVKKIIIGLGGSASVDGGIGMAEALGANFTDEMGDEIGRGGGALAGLAKISLKKMDSRLKKVTIEAACDVNNPLTGKNGAAHVYAPQKGADPEQVELLENNLKRMGKVIKKSLGIDVDHLPGAGAAGGMGAGLAAFLKARLKSGAEIVLNLPSIKEQFADSHLIITGEGQIDAQTFNGKAPQAVAQLAKKLHVPVIAIGGQISVPEGFMNQDFNAAFSAYYEPKPQNDTFKSAAINLEICTQQVLSAVKIGKLI